MIVVPVLLAVPAEFGSTVAAVEHFVHSLVHVEFHCEVAALASLKLEKLEFKS
jgi:hypothetical protein